MKQIVGCLCLVCMYFFLGSQTVSANSNSQSIEGYDFFSETNREAKELAEKIQVHIDENIPLNKQFPVYNTVRNRIKETIIQLDNSETRKRQLLKDLAFYHNDNILELVRYITSREGATERFRLWKQEEITKLEKQEKDARKTYDIRDDIMYFTAQGEFSKGGEVYKATYEIGGRIRIFKEGTGYIQVSNTSFERKIPFYEIIQEGADKFLLYSDSFFVEGDAFYTYKYEEYYPVNSTYGVYKSDFTKAGFDYEDAVFLRLQDAKNNVTIAPEKIKVFPTSYLENYGPLEKEFINTSVIDLLRVEKDYQDTYKNIIETAKEITKDAKTEEEKIQAVYDWLVKNVQYTADHNKEDYRIFSGLEAFENGRAVCEGQVALMYYLLKLAGVQDVEYIDGYIVNAEDFPETRHAWIEIGDYFYDPSFEKEYQSDTSEYLYYKIPYDIIYTNRYNTRDIPEGLFTTDPASIAREIDRRRYLLTEKYTLQDDYKLLEEAFFKKKYSIAATDIISLEHIRPYMTSHKYYLKNNTPTHTLPGVKGNVEYYPVPNLTESIEPILVKYNHDISNFVLLELYNNGTFVGYGLSDSLK